MEGKACAAFGCADPDKAPSQEAAQRQPLFELARQRQGEGRAARGQSDALDPFDAGELLVADGGRLAAVEAEGSRTKLHQTTRY